MVVNGFSISNYTVTDAYIVTFLIGSLIGLGEVLSRYRDAPFDAVRSAAGIIYIAFNGIFALIAMIFVHEIFPLWAGSGGANLPEGKVPPFSKLVVDTLMAGFGGMAVLRSSILTTRIGNKDVEVGPAAVIDIFRSTMDRSIARVRAQARATMISNMMGKVSFVRSYSSLSSIALTLLQGVDAEERSNVEQQIGALANQTGRSDRDKALELGLILVSSVGFPALKASIEALGSQIVNSVERPAFAAAQVSRLSLEEVFRDLPATCLALNPDVASAAQTALATQIDAIQASVMSNQAKLVNVGLLLVSIVGEENLKAGVDLLTSYKALETAKP